MTPEDFKLWRRRMELTQAEAARALGLGKSTVELYEAGQRRDTGARVEIPRAVALACAALFHRIGPWGEA
jgi:DNA-binding transcriptional regulator YiaG